LNGFPLRGLKTVKTVKENYGAAVTGLKPGENETVASFLTCQILMNIDPG
jgi:hypothetical protein